MVRSVTFVAFLALVFASVQCSENLDDVKVAVVESLSDYLRENPEVKSFQPLKKVESPHFKNYHTIYHLGKRIQGDRLVATANGTHSWGSPQDVKCTLSYPRTGDGAVVTFIQIPVEQSYDLGGAYVTSGGIGHRKITVVIEAKSTLFFKYTAQIFGY